MSTEPDSAELTDQAEGPDPDDYGRTGEPGERALAGAPFVRPLRLLALLAVLAAVAWWGGPRVMLVIAGVLVMIFFHELGHFVMARRAGMKVTEFMIGFGPRIFAFRRGDVEYGLKAIPAGAYVKIIGMANIEEVPAADEPRTYRRASYPARMGVAVAGSTMHFIMAFILITLSFVFVGKADERHWGIDTIAPDSAAARAGVRFGDRVISVDGVRVDTHEEMATEAQKRPGETIPVVVRRDGKPVELTATITPRLTIFGTVGEDLQVYGNADGGVSLSLAEGSAFEAAGVGDGDVISEVNGVAVDSVADVKRALRTGSDLEGGNVSLVVTHVGSETPRQVALDMGTSIDTDEVEGFFGVGQELTPQKLGVIAAVPESARWIGSTTSATVTGLGRFFSPSSLGSFAARTFSTAPGESNDSTTAQSSDDVAKANQERNGNRMMSIVGAVRFGSDMSESDLASLLLFFALLNMAIGILNLIPLPPFDGGHVALGTYEKIRELQRGDGKRYLADYNKVMPVAVAVVAFMLIVGTMAIYLDLADPIKV